MTEDNYIIAYKCQDCGHIEYHSYGDVFGVDFCEYCEICTGNLNKEA